MPKELFISEYKFLNGMSSVSVPKYTKFSYHLFSTSIMFVRHINVPGDIKKSVFELKTVARVGYWKLKFSRALRKTKSGIMPCQFTNICEVCYMYSKRIPFKMYITFWLNMCACVLVFYIFSFANQIGSSVLFNDSFTYVDKHLDS